MTGFVLATMPCWTCKQPFSFNPNAVPSIRIDGHREPICRNCIEVANRKRAELNLPPFVIDKDAYNALPEDRLGENVPD